MTAPIIDLDKFITLAPNVLGGKPHIAGHRIRVIDVAIWHEKLGLSADTIASKYNLSLAEVYAALAYYFDHRPEIETDLEKDESFVAEMKKRFPAKWLTSCAGYPPHPCEFEQQTGCVTLPSHRAMRHTSEGNQSGC